MVKIRHVLGDGHRRAEAGGDAGHNAVGATGGRFIGRFVRHGSTVLGAGARVAVARRDMPACRIILLPRTCAQCYA